MTTGLLLFVVATLQGLVVYGAAAASSLIASRCDARVRMAYWQCVLLLLVLLPLLQLGWPWRWDQGVGATALIVSRASSARGGDTSNLVPNLWWAVWCCGVAIRGGRMLLGLRGLRRMRDRAIPLEVGFGLPDLFRDAPAPPTLLSGAISVPASFGMARPAILLPAWFPSFPFAERKAIVTHEAVHILRGDWLLHLVEEGALCLAWFHPAVTATVRQIRLCREQVVDGETIRLTGERKEYIQVLVAVAQGPRQFPLASVFFTGRQLKKRIQAMQEESSMKSKRRRLAMPATLVAAVCAGVLWTAPLPSAVTGTEQIYRAGGDVVAPVVLSQTDAEYTPRAKAAKVEGTVVLSVVVGRNGLPAQVNILHSLDRDLDAQAVGAVKKWRFRPGTKGGSPVAVRASVEIAFRLL